MFLNDKGDLRVAEFHRAREAESTATPFSLPKDKLDYRAPEDEPFSCASDMFSVGVTLFEMATGKLPDPNNLDRDRLLATIDDPRKRELISFALHADPSKRPTAEQLLQRITMLASSSTLESEFRAQVFASMRFSAIGPEAEAKLLRGKLASQGVHLHIISLLAGESITRGVFETMATCDAFLAMATKDVRTHSSLCPPRTDRFSRAQYGQDTGNPAATFHEVRVWKEEHEPEGKPLIPLRMIPWGEDFTFPVARELFGSNLLTLTWIKGEPLPGCLVTDVLRGLGLQRLRV